MLANCWAGSTPGSQRRLHDHGVCATYGPLHRILVSAANRLFLWRGRGNDCESGDLGAFSSSSSAASTSAIVAASWSMSQSA
jgi:hypothetical protein